ncbi:MAG: hypothetical protein AABW84_01355 [Nanoarchaeota archaeon]
MLKQKTLSRKSTIDYLHNVAKKYNLPFAKDADSLIYTGTLTKTEDVILDLYEIVLEDKPLVASQLGDLSKLIPEYNKFLERADRFTNTLENKGLLSDGSLTKAGFESLKANVNLGAVSGVGITLPGYKLKNLLKHYGINTKQKSGTKAALASLAMLGAGMMGMAATKDLHPDLDGILIDDVSAQDEPLIKMYKSKNPGLNVIDADKNLGLNYIRLQDDQVLLANLDKNDIYIYNTTTNNYKHIPIDFELVHLDPVDIGKNDFDEYVIYLASDQSIISINVDTLKQETIFEDINALWVDSVKVRSPSITWNTVNTEPNDEYNWDVYLYNERDGALYNPDTEFPYTGEIVDESNGVAGAYGLVHTVLYEAGNDIYVYSGKTGNFDQVSPGSKYSERRHDSPDVWLDTAVWSCNGDCEYGEGIYIWNLRSDELRDMINDANAVFPVIDRDNVAWYSFENNALRIHNIQNNDTNDIIIDEATYLDISNEKIAWQTGNKFYLADLNNYDWTMNILPDDPPITPNNPTNNNNQTIPDNFTEISPELEALVEKHAPTLLFSKDESYFPTDPYADDSNVTNNALKWQKAEFPKDDKAIYYAVTDYSNTTSPEHPEGYKVIQYWSYYVYNDWGSDDHEYDWEVIHKWVDNKSGNVFYTSASMHWWDNNYQGDISRFLVEEGGHGMSKDIFMLDHIKMDFNGVGKVQDKNSYELRPLEDLLKYDASDFPGERGKFPTEQNRYKDPDSYIRLNPTYGLLTQISIKNSPELFAVDSIGRTTGLKNDKIVESIPNSKYFSAEERIIILGEIKPYIYLKGIYNEDYILEVKKVNRVNEDIRIKKSDIKQGETIKLEFADLPKNDFENNLQNVQRHSPILTLAGALGVSSAATIYFTRKKYKQTESKIKAKGLSFADFDDSKSKSGKAMSFDDFESNEPKSNKALSFEDFEN